MVTAELYRDAVVEMSVSMFRGNENDTKACLFLLRLKQMGITKRSPAYKNVANSSNTIQRNNTLTPTGAKMLLAKVTLTAARDRPPKASEAYVYNSTEGRGLCFEGGRKRLDTITIRQQAVLRDTIRAWTSS